MVEVVGGVERWRAVVAQLRMGCQQRGQRAAAAALVLLSLTMISQRP
jgi:hypothetical protein